MSRALSRTMKLPNTEKPFQCNVCEKQVRKQRLRQQSMTSFKYATQSDSPFFAVSSIKYASEPHENTYRRKTL
jgi:hypothetical protein